MNAVEIRNLTKNFGEKEVLKGLNMTVPIGAVYGFIGENGSGKSTTEKILCGLIHKSSGEIKIFGKGHTTEKARERVGVLIEAPGCFPNLSVWNNLKLQALNLSIVDPDKEIRKVLKLVRMEGAASNKYKNCSLGMKQRIGIAMALLGDPVLLVLDEPINGLDADGMRIMREIILDLTKKGVTFIISSHILGELAKVATHYGIIRGGKMIKEMTAKELELDCPTYVSVKCKNMPEAKTVLQAKYKRVQVDDNGYLRIYDKASSGDVVKYLFDSGMVANEVFIDKISLEEYYINLMDKERRG